MTDLLLKSMHMEVPDATPFDRMDWFEAVVGNFIKPIIEADLIESYWFSRYQDPKRHFRFRIKTTDYAEVQSFAAPLIKKLGLTDLADEQDYDGGEFRQARFVGDNRRGIEPKARQELIWEFLYASCRLYLDTFSYADDEGYWYREDNHDRANNIDGDTMESPHHLFCNLTGVAPRVDLIAGLDQGGKLNLQLMAGHYRRWMGIPDQHVRASQRVQF